MGREQRNDDQGLDDKLKNNHGEEDQDSQGDDSNETKPDPDIEAPEFDLITAAEDESEKETKTEDKKSERD